MTWKTSVRRRLETRRTPVGPAVGAVIACGLAAASFANVPSAQASVPTRHIAVANAGSIVFSRAANVWVAASDGSRQRQLTRDGSSSAPYEYPTQSDAGTVVALRGGSLHVLTRSGRVGKPIKVQTGKPGTGRLYTLPFGPAISPDGRRVAYSVAILSPGNGSGLLESVPQLIEYRALPSGKPAGKRHVTGSVLQSPSWIDSQRLLIFAPYHVFAEQVLVETFAGSLQRWFGDQLDGDSTFDRKLLDQGELTRAGDRLAAVRGRNLTYDWRGASIQLYAVSGLAGTPEAVCSIPARHGPLARPTWSPDGRMLAWSDSTGIWVSPVHTTVSGCGLSPRLVIKGGARPDWGPAPVSKH